MRVVSLVFLFACSRSHLTPDAGTGTRDSAADVVVDARDIVDVPVVDAASADAWVDRAPSLPPLIVAQHSEGWLTLLGVDLDGSSEELYRAEIGDDALRLVSPSPDGRFVLLGFNRHRSVDPFEFERLAFVVDLVTREVVSEPIEEIGRLDPTGVCDRAINVQRRLSWRPDSRAVYLSCERGESTETSRTRVEAATFEIGLDDSSRTFGTECVSLAMPTESEPLLIHGCVDGRYRLGDVPFPTGERVVHTWWNGMALTSILAIEGVSFRYQDLAWISLDSTEPVETSLPTGSLLLAVSPRGDLPIGFRPPGTAQVESVRILTRDGESIDTDLPPCAQTNGVPEHVRWARNASGFTASCEQGAFIVRRDGSVVRLRGTGPHFVEPVIDMRWSPDARHVLRADFIAHSDWRYVIHDAATGEPIRHLERLDSDARVRWRVGEAPRRCGPLTVCGW